MTLVSHLNNLKYWMYRHIGALGEAALKHRSAILLLSVLTLVIEPTVKLTFGSASVAGLGISVDPAQTIPLGLFLLVLLVYRVIAFWVSVLVESGTDPERAERKALYEYDPAYFAEENRPGDMGQLIKMESDAITYKWEMRKLLWEFALPNVLAIFCLVRYLIQYFH